MKGLDLRMADGSRHFASFPDTLDWYSLRDRLQATQGVQVTGFLTDDIAEAWIGFDFGGHRFTLNNPFGEYWAFVEDPSAPDSVLRDVGFVLDRILKAGRP